MNKELTITETLKRTPEIIPFQSENTKDLNNALANAQGDFPEIGKESSINHLKSKYASFGLIVKSVKEILKKYGLSVSHHAIREEGQSILLSLLRHNSGQWTSNRARIVTEKNDLLSYSRTLSGLKRLAFMNLLNITPHDSEE